MADKTTAAPRASLIRHVSVQVEVPEGASPALQNALTVQALLRKAARYGGADALTRHGLARIGPIRVRGIALAGPAPRPCATPRDLLDELLRLKEWAELSFAGLERGARELGYSPLPHSTIARLLSVENEEILPSQVHLTSFVLTCGVSEEEWRRWAIAWEDVQFILTNLKPWVLQGGRDGSDRVVSVLRRKKPADLRRETAE